MNLLTNLATRVRGAIRALRSLPAYDDFWYTPSSLLGSQGLAGVDITPDSALTVASCYRAMRILSDSVASLNCYLYERQANGGRRRATERIANSILNHQPNSELSPYRFKQTLMSNLLAFGNFYAYAARDERAVRRSLLILNPMLMRVERDKSTSELQYIFNPPSGSPLTFSPSEIWHVPGFGFNGIIGKSIITIAKEGLSLGKAQESYSSLFYGQGTHPGLVATTPQSLKPSTAKNLKDALTQTIGGLGRSHSLLLLQDGLKLENITINPVDAEFIASRKFQVTEVARWFGIPSHMLGDSEATKGKSNLEVESSEFVKYSLRPYLSLIESELSRFFLTPDERQQYYWEFNTDALLKGDIKSRYAAYKVGREMGFLSGDDIRSKENLPPMRDGLGQLYLVQPGATTLDMIASGKQMEVGE